jgi:sugar/nucleoside kinase (ribokinase family)
MRIVGIGDLVCDIYYDEKLNIIGAFGGISFCNIICNLQYMGYRTYVYGSCGDDYLGKICIDSLTDCNVKNNIKKIKDIYTKAYHIRKVKENNRDVFRSIKYCPYCKKSSWYDESFIDEKSIIKKIKDDDVLVFDNLNNRNQYIIDNTKNTKLLDLGTYYEFEKLARKEIIKKLDNKFEIINLNERVEKFLITKLNCKDVIELSKLIKAKLLIITRGINGNDFVYQNNIYSYPLDEIIDEVDDSGAGDAFFSVIINNWLKNKQVFSPDKFSVWVNDTRSLVKKILMLIGSRTYIKEMYLVTKNDICNRGDYNE